jgi:hypothetical protein
LQKNKLTKNKLISFNWLFKNWQKATGWRKKTSHFLFSQQHEHTFAKKQGSVWKASRAFTHVAEWFIAQACVHLSQTPKVE